MTSSIRGWETLVREILTTWRRPHTKFTLKKICKQFRKGEPEKPRTGITVSHLNKCLNQVSAGKPGIFRHRYANSYFMQSSWTRPMKIKIHQSFMFLDLYFWRYEDVLTGDLSEIWKKGELFFSKIISSTGSMKAEDFRVHRPRGEWERPIGRR